MRDDSLGVRRGAYTFQVSSAGLRAFKNSKKLELEPMTLKIEGKLIRKASTEVSF